MRFKTGKGEKMEIAFNAYMSSPVSMKAERKNNRYRQPISALLKPFETSKEALVPPLKLMKGINPNSSDVFDSFTKIDDVTRKINFTKDQDAWITCLSEELEEFVIARDEYNQDKSQANKEHMEEEMGDIFYTAASIAKDCGIDPQDAFKATNRKFFNRINLMERFYLTSKSQSENLADCTDEERRALWNAAKYKLYGVQAKRFALDA